MRDVFFIVADGQTAETIEAFLARSQSHKSLETGPFDFDRKQDMINLPTNDPGVFTDAPDLSRNYSMTHRKLVVVLDEAWDTKQTPTAQHMRDDLSKRLVVNGWGKDDFSVIVIAPELENWIWQDNLHVAKVFGFDKLPGFTGVKAMLEAEGVWDNATGKPRQPKETLEKLCRRARTRPDRHRYAQVAKLVSVKSCKDTAFQELRATLQRWFPVVDEEAGTAEAAGASV